MHSFTNNCCEIHFHLLRMVLRSFIRPNTRPVTNLGHQGHKSLLRVNYVQRKTMSNIFFKEGRKIF